MILITRDGSDAADEGFLSDDKELLRAWRMGDRRAGSALFARHFASVRRFFGNKVHGSVEDLVQETFVACVEGRDRFREASSFRTYIFAIARHRLHEYFRCARRTEELDLDKLSIIDLGASPPSQLDARSEEQLLLRALREIPVALQVILELYYWEGMSGPELGEVLGVPENTARSRLRKARIQLKATMRRLTWGLRGLDIDLTTLDQWARSLRPQHPSPS